MKRDIHTITGGFGYTGTYLSKVLIKHGKVVETLTNSPEKKSIDSQILAVHPLDFENKEGLIRSLKNTEVLYNTYWVRFNHKWFNHQQAVTNTFKLFFAAKKAGVKRIVHVSITNADSKSNLDYFRGKGEIEEYLKKLEIEYTIVRPAVLFGGKDILINNIAWSLRHLPIVGMPGRGKYQLQPIHVYDFAKQLAYAGEKVGKNIEVALGPERYSYVDLLYMIKKELRLKTVIIPLPNRLAWLGAQILGYFLNDVMLTWPEVLGLRQETLWEDQESTGKVHLSEWVKKHKDTLGNEYHNELDRRKNKVIKRL